MESELALLLASAYVRGLGRKTGRPALPDALYRVLGCRHIMYGLGLFIRDDPYINENERQRGFYRYRQLLSVRSGQGIMRHRIKV